MKENEMGVSKKKPAEEDDVVKDWGLIGNINAHIQVYGFASIVDSLVAACEDKVKQWEERCEKAKKLRKALGKNYGRN